MASLALAAPFTGRPDVRVAVSPCFPALLPTMVSAKARGIPWALWLQDILPDGAATTGLVKAGPLLSAARMLEASAYRSASRVIVISEAFRRNLQDKGVPSSKIATIYNPAARSVGAYRERPDRTKHTPAPGDGEHRLLAGPRRVRRRQSSAPTSSLPLAPSCGSRAMASLRTPSPRRSGATGSRCSGF